MVFEVESQDTTLRVLPVRKWWFLV